MDVYNNNGKNNKVTGINDCQEQEEHGRKWLLLEAFVSSLMLKPKPDHYIPVMIKLMK